MPPGRWRLHVDDLARYNKARWEELAEAGVIFSRPKLHLDADSARATVDPEGCLGDPAGKDVLCLAGGGGQQSAAFGVLGAQVTVLDLCETQLRRDREAAAHYGLEVRCVPGDMRDLSCFEAESFDVVWHAHSLNFVPDAARVFDEVVRVLRPGGLYRLECWNPFAHAAFEAGWNGSGYTLAVPYVEGAPMEQSDPFWEVLPWDRSVPSTQQAADLAENPEPVRILGPKEFRHTLGTIVNGLIERGLAILGLWEKDPGTTEAEPGTWEHFKAYLPPWLAVWARKDSPPVGSRRRP